MSDTFHGVPLVPFVLGVVAKMKASERTDKHTFHQYWAETYNELGGRSSSSRDKGCPRAATYALFRLGLIKDSGQPLHMPSLPEVKKSYGRNGAYAVLALQMLTAGHPRWDGLWEEVKQSFRNEFREEPAVSEQGGVRITYVLFTQGRLLPGVEGNHGLTAA